jgi:hypothetical protein
LIRAITGEGVRYVSGGRETTVRIFRGAARLVLGSRPVLFVVEWETWIPFSGRGDTRGHEREALYGHFWQLDGNGIRPPDLTVTFAPRSLGHITDEAQYRLLRKSPVWHMAESFFAGIDPYSGDGI